MSDADAGNVKAKASIEYDPSGMKQFKEDLASLPQMVGGLGQSAGDAGEKLSELDKGMTSNAESAKSFTSALSELPKITESGTAAVSEMSGVLSEQRSAIEETASAHETLQKSVESSVSAFEKAPSSIRAVSEHTQFLQEQMSVASDSFSQAGSSIAQVTPTFREAFNIPTDAVLQFDDAGRLIGDSAKYFETASSGAQSFGKSFQGSSSDVQTFAGQVGNLNTVVAETHKGMNGISETAFSASKAMDSAGASTGQWVEASNGFMAKLGDVMEGPAYSKPVKMGDAFGEVMGGITGALNDIAMPLMAVQMIAQTVQQVGQAMYDSAAIAEGPAAHSFGTFTGTVDALGQSLQNASGQFSEGFGQELLPTLNALNSQAGSSDLGELGHFVGGIATTLANLSLITTGIDPLGGTEGLINQGASMLGLQQPFQGPAPVSQYQQQMNALPQTVHQNAQQLQYQGNLTMAEATNPEWLAQNNENMASQRAASYLIGNYNSSHPIPQSQVIANARYNTYAAQQEQNYQDQMNNQPGFFQTYFQTMGDMLGINSAPPPTNPNATRSSAQNYGSNYGQTGYGGGEPSGGGGGGIDWGGIGHNISGFFGGIGQDFHGLWDGLFGGGGGGQSAPSTFTGGCFVAGTPVLMADGSSKAIEALRVDERVLAYDGEKQVPATIVACIEFPAKQTYELVFSDGNVLTTTDSHPIATTQGWKSISPESTAQENPGLSVTVLAVGDSIYTAIGTLCRLISIEKREIVQVFNITVDTCHTYYANNILVHNAKLGNTIGANSLGGDGTGSQQVQVSHTFVANVQWEANNLSKQFTGAASWVGQNLANTFQGAASWVAQGLSNTFQGAATWVAQGLSNTFNGVANWVGQGLANTFNGVANWVGQGLANTFNGVASWMGEGLSNTFKGVASWAAQGLEHTFNAVANWSAQNLTPNFTVNPSFTMLAEGTSNWGGGPAIVGEAGPEVVESNGRYSMFDAGASLVNLPSGANVYPMKNLGSAGVAQFADGTSNIIPLNIGLRGGGMPESISLTIQIGENDILSAVKMPFAQDMRVVSGNRSY
jgi:hypothetical protein